jgi:DNA-binding FrmR family transcriptional regulator
MRGYTLDKDSYLRRLRKIEGQVRGLQRMIDDDAYCIDVVTQVGSVTGALHAIALGLVDQHLRHCVMDAAASPDGDPDAKLTEATRAIERLLHSLGPPISKRGARPALLRPHPVTLAPTSEDLAVGTPEPAAASGLNAPLDTPC